MCEKCEEKKCKRSCGHRKRPCEHREPESKPCPLPPKCAAAQACGLKPEVFGGDVVGVLRDGIVPFVGSNNLVWPASSSISVVNGVVQIDEPGVYLVCYSIHLSTAPDPAAINTQVELRISNSCGICPTSCGGCQYQPLTTAVGLPSVPCSVGVPDDGGQIIQRTVLVNVQYPCARLVLVNISTVVEDVDQPPIIELDITPASLSIVKCASCGC